MGGLLEGLGDGCHCLSDVAGTGELGTVLAGLLVVIAVALSVVLVVWLVGRAVAAWRRHKQRLRPRGARRGLDFRQRGTWIEGEVVSGVSIGSWTGAQDCVAWGVEVRSDDAREGDVLLRDGNTAGFSLRVDDGRTAVVPAGRARVQAEGEVPSSSREQLDGETLTEQLGALAKATDPYERVVPADRAESVLLRVGDRVRVYGPLEPFATGGGGFREGATSWRLVGGPLLTRLG